MAENSPERPTRRPPSSEWTADVQAIARRRRRARPPVPRPLPPPPPATSARRLLLPILLLPAAFVGGVGVVAPPRPVPVSDPRLPPSETPEDDAVGGGRGDAAAGRVLQRQGGGGDSDPSAAKSERAKKRRKRKKRMKGRRGKKSQRQKEVQAQGQAEEQQQKDDQEEDKLALALTLKLEPVEIFDTITLVLGGLCANDDDWTPYSIGRGIEGLSEETFTAIERAILNHFRREVESGCDGGSDANFTAVTVVSFEEGTECQKAQGRGLQESNKQTRKRGGRRKTRVGISRRYVCRRCPKRTAALPEDSLIPGNRALLRQDDSGSHFNFFTNRRLQQCPEDRLSDSLWAEPELEDVITSANITATDVKDCALTSPDCVSDTQEDFACCGASGCQCRVGSESNCAQEECRLFGQYGENLCCATGESGEDFLFGLCEDRCQVECAGRDYITQVQGRTEFSFSQRMEVLNFCGDDEVNKDAYNRWPLTPETRKRFEEDMLSFLNVEMELDGCGPFVTFGKVSVTGFKEMQGCKDKRSGKSDRPGQSIVDLVCQGTCNAYCPGQMNSLGQQFYGDPEERTSQGS